MSTRNRGAARGAAGSGGSKLQKPTEYKYQEGTEGPCAGCGTSKDTRTEPWCQERTEGPNAVAGQERRRWCRVGPSRENQGAEYMLRDQGKENKRVTCTAWSSTSSPYCLCAGVLAGVTDIKRVHWAEKGSSLSAFGIVLVQE